MVAAAMSLELHGCGIHAVSLQRHFMESAILISQNAHVQPKCEQSYDLHDREGLRLLAAVANPARSSKAAPKSRAYHDHEGCLVSPD
jgi:hypothetical protein